MTMAVCLKCGEIKFGAFCPCACGHWPKEPEDLAKHLMVTDHHFPMETLEQISAVIKSGQEVHFRPEDVAATLEVIRKTSEFMPAEYKDLMQDPPPAPAEDSA